MKRAVESNALVYKSGEGMARALEVSQKSAAMAETIERATEGTGKRTKADCGFSGGISVR